jgi:cation:H+ antiporter
MIIAILAFVLALVVVVKSADFFLDAAEKTGVYLNIHSFILGVVLVGFGTSLPELATSIAAVTNGQYDIAIPNIVGSNIANILLIVGLCTVILGTITFKKNLIDLDLPLLLSTVFIFSLLAFDGSLSRVDGGLLLLSFVGYILYSLFYDERQEYHRGLTKLIFALRSSGAADSRQTADKPGLITYVTLVVSVVTLGLASKFAVDSLLLIVAEINIAVSVVSFFALAIGTSLPELTVSLKALKKGQGDVLIGNIIGSCMFNMLLIGGVASLLHPQTLEMGKGIWMLAGMLIATLLLLVSGITKRIHIWEGAALITVYIAIGMHIM